MINKRLIRPKILSDAFSKNMAREDNVPDWKLKDDSEGKLEREGRVKDWTTGRKGKILPSSGYSWKDIDWDDN